MPATPQRSYIVWHSQRTGSTLLCTALENTHVAGVPNEWPSPRIEALLPPAGANADPATIRQALWESQTAGGVFGMKWSFHAAAMTSFIAAFGALAPPGPDHRRDVWNAVFPNCSHVITGRRNRVWLAVSWWKSIFGGAGHRSASGERLPWQTTVPAEPDDLVAAYDLNDIKVIPIESVEREAGISEFIAELGATALTVVYEDFAANYEGTVQRVLDHIGMVTSTPVPPSMLAPTTDAINDRWTARFLAELADEREQN